MTGSLSEGKEHIIKPEKLASGFKWRVVLTGNTFYFQRWSPKYTCWLDVQQGSEQPIVKLYDNLRGDLQ